MAVLRRSDTAPGMPVRRAQRGWGRSCYVCALMDRPDRAWPADLANAADPSPTDMDDGQARPAQATSLGNDQLGRDETSA